MNVVDLTDGSNSNSDSDIFVDTITAAMTDGKVFTNIAVGPVHKKTSLKIDSGSKVNILPLSTFQGLGIKHALKPSKTKLYAYAKTQLKCLGTVMLRCSHDSFSSDVEFHIVETSSTPLFGLTSCIDFGLITVMFHIKQF